jgi:hypothetical protein
MNSNAVPGERSPKYRPLDWNLAVRVAAARLSEQAILPDTMGYALLTGEAQRLAALLCAYGKLAEEADRMQRRADEAPAGPQQRQASASRTEIHPGQSG